MKKYLVEITETLQKQLIIEAHSREEAESIARHKYRKEEIVLSENDYIDTDFQVIQERKNKNIMER